MVALGGVPGPSPGRAAQPAHEPPAPGDAAGARRHRAGGKPGPSSASAGRAEPRTSPLGRSAAGRGLGGIGPAAARSAARLKPKACRRTRRWARAAWSARSMRSLRGTPGGALLAGERVLAYRRTAGGRARAQLGLARGPAAAVDGARRPVRRHRRDGALDRRDPGGGGDRAGRAAAAGVDLQDDHPHGRPRRRGSPTRRRCSPTPPTRPWTASS